MLTDSIRSSTSTESGIFPSASTEHRATSLESFYPDTNANANVFSSIIPRSAATSSSNAIPQDPFIPPQQSETPITRLLAYLFSPEQYSTNFQSVIGHYKSLPDYVQSHQPVLADDWGEIGTKLRDPSFQKECVTMSFSQSTTAIFFSPLLI